LLLYLYEGKADCLYLDPPYNTGARDWTYNNRFVDANDSYRHSKWLSFMEKRLRLAKRLLKPDGVLVITIDEHEVHHLGMLLERVFPDARRQMVTICINPSGVSGEGLSRVEEYAFYCFLGKSGPVKTGDDLLSATTKAADYIRWEALMRGGNAWYRAKRPNLCYPIVLTRDGNQIVGVGDPLPFHNKEAADAAEESRRSHTPKRSLLAWPVRKDGKLGIWRVDGTRLMDLVKDGYAYVSSRDEERQTWTIRYLMSGTVKAIERGLIAVVGKGDRGEALLRRKVARETTAKTVWHRGRHTAGGAGGTHLLASFLGERDLFPFPKSLYAVRDCLDIAVGDRKDTLILDFFAGSGTTLHATVLMNAADAGTRRCVLVTNNEVNGETANALRKAGHWRGSVEFEREGIFNKVTVHASCATFTQVGIGIVRTRPCFPTRSTMHHRPSRCWTWPTVSAATSDRRSPQPRSTARIARSRSPLVVLASGVFSSVWACLTESQFPKRTPFDATPFTGVIPAANSGASSPLSAASTASLRTAVIRTLMETAPRPRASSATRQAHTVAFVNPGRGSRSYHSKNSSSPRL
jgi:adenine-specific DNA-methyltransferase